MAIPQISDYFGANSQVITSDQMITANESNPALVIYFGDFQAQGFDNVSGFTDPDKVLAAIVKKVKVFTDADAAEESGVEIANPTKSFTTRKQQSAVAIAYDLAFFIPDPTQGSIDPDNVI